jgi:hypothetical protein
MKDSSGGHSGGSCGEGGRSERGGGNSSGGPAGDGYCPPGHSRDADWVAIAAVEIAMAANSKSRIIAGIENCLKQNLGTEKAHSASPWIRFHANSIRLAPEPLPSCFTIFSSLVRWSLASLPLTILCFNYARPWGLPHFRPFSGQWQDSATTSGWLVVCTVLVVTGMVALLVVNDFWAALRRKVADRANLASSVETLLLRIVHILSTEAEK